jgi:hypothetical protein
MGARRLTAFVAIALLGLALPSAAPAAKHRAAVFPVCAHGCRYRSIQAAADAAGAYAFRNRKARVKVTVRPGHYVEEVALDGAARHRRFDGMTIEGTRPNRKRTVLEGRGARGRLGAAQYGIVASGVDGLVVRNIWARNYGTAGFAVTGAGETGAPCAGFRLENLFASGNGSYGLLARDCLGGRMVESAALHQGAAGFAVLETPCDDPFWTPYSGAPCQATPAWTLLGDDASYENAVGFLGTNAKYTRVVGNAFYDDGTGILVASTGTVARQPNGWNMIERNDAFWNNYDSYLAESPFPNVTEGLGELAGQALHYPTGVGIAIYGGDGDVVRRNRVFGNEKWGIASFSGPGETLVVDELNEAKNVNNEVVENTLGRSGADPNGEFDIFDDASGGGNCWGANSGGASFAPGNGKVGTAAIYPTCPQPRVGYGTVRSLATEAGLQVAAAPAAAAKTVLGYAASDPPQDQQCSWVRRVTTHPAFQRFEPSEVPVRPGDLSC